MLKIARNKCHRLFQQIIIKELETHLKTFKERLEEMNNLKSKVTELMVKRDERIKHIEEWSSKHEAEVEENDVSIQELQTNKKELKERENEERKAGKAEEDQIEKEHLHRSYGEEKQLETMKRELRRTFEQKTEGNSGKQLKEDP